jgi:hypothetical protein
MIWGFDLLGDGCYNYGLQIADSVKCCACPSFQRRMTLRYCLALFGLVSVLALSNGFISRVPSLRGFEIARESGKISHQISTRYEDSNFKLRCSSSTDENSEALSSPRRLSYLTLWVGLLAYTTDFSTHLSAEAEAAAPAILQTCVVSPFDGSISPVFIALFLALGIIPTVYGSLLLPSSKQQKVWALPFVASSFGLGFFGLGPYLGLRNKSPSLPKLTSDDRDTGSAIFDNKITPLFLLASALYLVYYALNGSYDGVDRWQGYWDLFNTQPLARISTIDFTILSLAVSPSNEDFTPYTELYTFTQTYSIIYLATSDLNMSHRCGIPSRRTWSGETSSHLCPLQLSARCLSSDLFYICVFGHP